MTTNAALADAILDMIFTEGAIDAPLSSFVQLAGSPQNTLYVELHTADPTASGTQSSSETTYTGYTRMAVARTGFTRSGNTVTFNANVTFPTPTAGGGTPATFFSIGMSNTGTAGAILFSGSITGGMPITVGTPPILASGTSFTLS